MPLPPHEVLWRRAVARLREQYRPRLVLLCGDFNEDAERREPTCLHADLTKPP